MASVSDIAPLNTTVDTGLDAKAEITKLAETIKDSATRGLKSATQTVVGSVPKMITDLTKEIQSGPINSFGLAMNKLVTLVDKLGINLRQYNEELADTVDEYRGSQEKLQQKLHELRTEGIKAEINDRGDGIRYITNLEVKKYEKEREISNQSIETNKEEIQERIERINSLEKQGTLTKKNRNELQQEIDTREKANDNLQEEVDIVNSKIGKTADTGGTDQQGFGKIAELKEAFMIIPDTISEVFGGVKNIGKVIGKQFKGFLGAPMKTIARVFKNIGTMFRTFRLLIALKIIAIIAAIQFVIEKLGFLIEPIQKVWDAITGFFKKIGDWFRNSWLGKKLGLGDDDEVEKTIESKADESRGELKQLYIKKHGEEEGSKMYDEWESKQDAGKTKIKPKGRMRKFETEKVDIVPLESDQDMSEKPVSKQRTRGGGKKFFQKKKEVVGQTTEDGDTSKVLKELEAEHLKELNKSVIQVNNNSNITSQNQSGTTVSGFIDHEPDTSFKYIRNNNSDSTWI